MRRFLFTLWPFAGHVHPAIAMAQALRGRGHEVAFYTGDGARSLIEGEGFTLFPFTRVDETRVSELASSSFPHTSSVWRRLRMAPKIQASFRAWLLDTIPQQIEDLEVVVAKWRPDVVVCDLSFWGPILILSETGNHPVAVMSVTAACILPGPGAPAWGNGSPRPRSGFMRFRARLSRALLHWASVGFRADVNRMRRSYQLAPLLRSVTEFAGQMPLYLVPSTPEYDYDRKDLPASVQYVGPCLWDRPAGARSPEWLAELRSDQPLVYVTEATIGTAEPFLLKTAVLALQDLPVQVVMTTGKQRNPQELGLPAAPNVRVEAYVPQSDLLPKTAVMVTLGGSGGVLAALALGVPLVIVPTEWDRPENAQRVVEAGAGLRLAPNQCTPELLRAAVQRVLSEPSFRQNAQRLATSFARYGGPHRAAELLEAFGSNTTNSGVTSRKKLSYATGS